MADGADFTFYLGTHMPHWLRTVRYPLFISHRRLLRYKTLPIAAGPWALDSGGFTELSMFGTWQTTPTDYVNAVRRYRDNIGQLEWAAPQDWMCEPFMLSKTGKTVAEHQRLTVDNYRTLTDIAPDLPFVPVLQGWDADDYLRHVDDYTNAGIDLASLPLVGLGSVCRRQQTSDITQLVTRLSATGLRLHGFGVKTQGLDDYGHLLTSADSLAWSFGGRRVRPCPHSGVTNCANCLPHALTWRQRVITPRRSWTQAALF